ncbi:carbon starvation CstA family protein [Pontibacter korlensis]|uniref:carbon starvation CstA family protein n=1 Tax=Pontibacter korlensis TaxID=400092 RepID=UPI000B086E6E
MALGVLVVMVVQRQQIPEVRLTRLTNQHMNPDGFPLFPMLFVTIACGAVSGFHASQSPLWPDV